MPGIQLHLLQDLREIGILKFITQLPLCGEYDSNLETEIKGTPSSLPSAISELSWKIWRHIEYSMSTMIYM